LPIKRGLDNVMAVNREIGLKFSAQ